MSDMAKWLLGIATPLIVAALFYGGNALGAAFQAGQDSRYLRLVAFQEFESQLAEQETKKELRTLKRSRSDVKYELSTTEDAKEQGRLEERLNLLEEQISELELQLQGEDEE